MTQSNNQIEEDKAPNLFGGDPLLLTNPSCSPQLHAILRALNRVTLRDRLAIRSVFQSVVLTLTLCNLLCLAVDWSQFRGPNGSGLSDEKEIPIEFGPDLNVIWKTAL